MRGATVRIIYLPSGPGGAKVGLDDFLASGKTVDNLLALAADRLREPPGDREAESPYVEQDGRLYLQKRKEHGDELIPLANFTARIVADICEDDGAEERRAFEIEASLAGRDVRFTIPASRFSRMGWPTEYLGATPIVAPGFGLRDQARAAIQTLSTEIEARRVFTHAGWRRVNGRDVFLHTGGALGADGVVPGVEVRLAPPLDRLVVPEPPGGEAARRALRASLAILTLAPDIITIPILAAVYRALLGDSDFAVHLAGRTGVGKTELAALAQQHVGATFDARHLPGSWSSTANALEALAFTAKDVPLVVDDFAPAGGPTDVQRGHREADRLLRAAGNAAGRARLTADLTMRPARPPRALLISTGEDVPRGQSLRARMLVIEVSPDDLDWSRLSGAQAEAAAGRYAEAMAVVIGWIARHGLDAVRRRFRAEVVRLRNAGPGLAHRRTPGIVAELATAFGLVLHVAGEAGALTAEEQKGLWRRAWGALTVAGTAQATQQAASDPVERFRALLTAAIASGKAHVAAPDGTMPADHPGAWGGRRPAVGPWEAKGARVGWLDGGDLYLEPEAAYAAAQEQGRAGGDGLAVTSRTLRKRLAEAKRLVTVDTARETLTVRKVLDGGRREVLHLRADFLGLCPSVEPDQPDRNARAAAERLAAGLMPARPWSGEPDHRATEPTTETNAKSGTSWRMVGMGGLDAQRASAAVASNATGVSNRTSTQSSASPQPDQHPTTRPETRPRPATDGDPLADWRRRVLDGAGRLGFRDLLVRLDITVRGGEAGWLAWTASASQYDLDNALSMIETTLDAEAIGPCGEASA